MEVAGESQVGKFRYYWDFPTSVEYYAWQRKQQEEHQAAVRRQQAEYEAAQWRQQMKQLEEEVNQLLHKLPLQPRPVEQNNAPPCCPVEDPVMMPSPELKASPELFFLGGGGQWGQRCSSLRPMVRSWLWSSPPGVNLATLELQPEAYGEVSAVELPLEVNLATTELQPEAYGEVLAVELLPAEEAVPLSGPAEEAVPLPCTTEEAVQLSGRGGCPAVMSGRGGCPELQSSSSPSKLQPRWGLRPAFQPC
ncbi:uncharacterized protein LOC128606840 isoform X1 [Ictalurus furcatus]|uniref:uncharacterized protein LOC128606840 isoform X1 n=1 Tax=Ictalurus furcatus TaxID=66913 RepID=UPI00235099CF|nr:uncharacterized protein LOC128606840 isoform X1 [Ictalurus furcatus]XP_053479289.1 uncharacterized protein LOC128606840 isoform X1 [Ictalurus furcatus]XP_053479290.1 uncharacterized protein LOC128606840 isoform X1 [Ictalurus furcatus]XP_053479291.1 uncharacterized protein LOC128606840 isoform X1 [Ictalurus furcatus]XP_053479292.1 uncharacterized protein LOC128606840 isoform X1 [Ictalurus furcatus]XP_053479293.1 uncharacterized protein LOC128606840 isoform X1 [Ictalurus furcatus]